MRTGALVAGPWNANPFLVVDAVTPEVEVEHFAPDAAEAIDPGRLAEAELQVVVQAELFSWNEIMRLKVWVVVMAQVVVGRPVSNPGTDLAFFSAQNSCQLLRTGAGLFLIMCD